MTKRKPTRRQRAAKALVKGASYLWDHYPAVMLGVFFGGVFMLFSLRACGGEHP